MLDKVTKDTFQPVQGEVFNLVLRPGEIIPLELTAVRGTGLQGLASREQFSLHFKGPAAPALPQQIYRLEHPALGALEIFLVPIRRDGEGMTYEAVFT